MHTQNTPVHIKLWHRDFWLMAFANMLLTMSVYMFIPVLPLVLQDIVAPVQTALVMGCYGVGVFILGGFCSFLVQRYRRNHVCLWAIMAMIICIGLMYYALGNVSAIDTEWWIVLLLRLILGATFGLSQMVLTSTLIIDTCESFQRTEANHSSAWFGRFALSLGPLFSLVIYDSYNFRGILIAAAVCCVISMILIKLVHFPFRAPEENISVFTLDRFFLPQGIWLFINLALTTAVIGMLMTLKHVPMFYCMMMIGFFMALLAQKYVFVNAELKSEVITGQLLIIAALLMMIFGRDVSVSYIVPVLVGLGIGIVGARYLLFFIKLSRHCQRGTSQSTYFLAWEFGLSLGLFVGYIFLSSVESLLYIALITVVVSTLLYLFFTHSWYVRKKNR